jgi:hypothetical protein
VTYNLLDPDGEPAMPYVATVANGGPYDTAAYTAGWEACLIMVSLRTLKPGRYARRIAKANVEQVDLIAMHAGYVMKTLPCRDNDLEVLAEFILGDHDLPVENPYTMPL